MRKLPNILPVSLVTGLSLLLLTYVGYGEALRTFPTFQHDRMAAQGEIVQNAIQTYLRAGLPLSQFIGFDTVTQPIRQSDRDLESIVARDRAGNVVFSAGQVVELAGGDGLRGLFPSEGAGTARFVVREAAGRYLVILPLQSRFETAGTLTLSVPKAVVLAQVDGRFKQLLVLVAALTLAVAAVAGAAELARARRPLLVQQTGYGVAFAAMAVAVTWGIIALYSDGVEGKTRALADSLAQRLGAVVDLGLELQDIDGLAQTFADYRRLNPEISEIALTVGKQIAIGTDPEGIGTDWSSRPNSFEYAVALQAGGDGDGQLRLAVAVPMDLIYRKLARSAKNFAVLFVACALVSLVFVKLAGAARRLRESTQDAEAARDLRLSLVTPVFFLAVFIEALNASFLPQMLQQVAGAAGVSDRAADLLFMTYFLGFAVVLIPAGRYAEAAGPRPPMLLGALLASLGLFGLTCWTELGLVVAARGLSGIGQGLLFIGVQSYILKVASAAKRTQGAAIIVFAFNGAIISGSSIGGLLVTYMGETGVFLTAGALGLASALYVVAVIPNVQDERQAAAPAALSPSGMLRDLAVLLRDLEFMRTMMLVGIPAKAVLTGVAIFALPLVLSQQAFAKEDIGQIIMLYGAGVLLASRYVSTWVDRFGSSRAVLLIGALLSALALAAMGGGAMPELEAVVPLPHAGLALLLGGVLLLGLAHGFINAPVVTHVAGTGAAQRIGSGSATATYRFLERLGHVAGPLVAGQLLLITGGGADMLVLAGAAVALMALLFALPVGARRGPASEDDTQKEDAHGIAAPQAGGS